MAFSDNLKALRLKAGLKQKELADRLHMSQQAIAKWETGKSEPNINTLRDIADALQCNTEDLLDESDLDIQSQIAINDGHAITMTNFENMCAELDEKTLDRIHTVLYSLRRIQNNTIIYASDKQYLFACIAEIVGRIERYVDDYRLSSERGESIDLSVHNKRFISGEVEVLKEITNIITPQKATAEERHIVIPLYETPASAGYGSWLEDETPLEWITVPRNDKTVSSDFILEIRGDSMQPEFFDGEKVLIEQTLRIYEGEIGVFILNGESFIKKMGRGELISLNPAYEPIKLTDYDDIRCVGKVIDKINLE